MTKKSKGYAFISFVFPQDAIKACNAMDNQFIKGRIVHVTYAKANPYETQDQSNASHSSTGYKDKKEKELKAKAGNHLHDISNTIDAYISKFGYGIVRDLVGHGIGTSLHEDPQIPNFAQRRKGVKLQPGMTLAIEPMINMGRCDVEWLDDDWTVVTEDGSLSAHYENTILICEDGPEILTL